VGKMINTAYFLAVLFIFLRMVTFFTMVPVLFPKGTPNTLKMLFTLLISFILLPGVNSSGIAGAINNNYVLILYCVNEVITGLILGYLTSLCFNIVRMAGQLMDMQMGFAMLSMFDPTSNSNVTLLERLLYWVSLIMFLIIDGHHMLLRALVESFNAVGIGKSILFQDTIMYVINTFIQYFALGLKIAIPIVLIIIITDLTLGLIARTVPQLNVMVLGLPIKIIVGLTCFSFALPFIIKAIVYSFNYLPDIFKEVYKVAPLMLIFASEEKTEDATPRKKSEARKKGQVAKSKEVSLALTLLTSTILIVTLGGFVGNNLKYTLTYFLGNGFETNLDYNNLENLLLIVLWRIGITFLPVVVPIMVMGVFANYIQTGFMFSGETIKPKLSKLNPMNGFQRMFSTRTVVELFKDLGIVSVVGYVGYKFIKDNYRYILTLGNVKIGAIPMIFKDLAVSIFFKITLIMIVLALADYIYQRYMFGKDLKMTKQEIKEEFKQDEGDPQIKSKIKQKQRELATRRMMQQIPDATVVVTNPTHIAVALKYEEGKSEAPIVVAKGSDYVAIKIKEIAKESNVPILENKPLARLIFNEVELEKPIPAEMYQAVAEILAVVYKLQKRKK
jgi:flagellar biosynthesis protein FliR/FlhB